MRRSLLVLALVLSAACRSTAPTDEPPDLEQQYVEALATVFTSGRGGPVIDDTTAECAALAMVGVVTVEALRSSDISPQELADSDDLASLGVQVPTDAIAVLAAALGECAVGDAMEEPFVRRLASDSGGEISDDAVACVVQASSSTDLEDGLAATFVDQANGNGAYDEITRAVGACPLAMTELILNTFEQSGATLDNATRACVSRQVEADPVAAATTFTGGGLGADGFGAALLDACPGLAVA